MAIRATKLRKPVGLLVEWPFILRLLAVVFRALAISAATL
jgi:hypothetical protein